MPTYVFKELIWHKDAWIGKDFRSRFDSEDEDDIVSDYDDWIDLKWKKELREVNLSNFDPSTQKEIIKRDFGMESDINIKDDEKRNKFQQALIKKTKPGSNEPIVVLQKSNGLELYEGWHRTMAILYTGNNGNANPKKWNRVKLNMWIGK
jgi:hypothetical protein